MREVLDPAVTQGAGQVGDDRVGIDAADARAAEVRSARDHHLALDEQARAEYPGHRSDARQDRIPALPAPVLAIDDDVRAVAEDLLLEIVAEAAHHRERRRERAAREAHREDREAADDGEKAALASAEQTCSDEGLEGGTLDGVEQDRDGAEERAEKKDPGDGEGHRGEGGVAILGRLEGERVQREEERREHECVDAEKEPRAQPVRQKEPGAQRDDELHRERGAEDEGRKPRQSERPLRGGDRTKGVHPEREAALFEERAELEGRALVLREQDQHGEDALGEQCRGGRVDPDEVAHPAGRAARDPPKPTREREGRHTEHGSRGSEGDREPEGLVRRRRIAEGGGRVEEPVQGPEQGSRGQMEQHTERVRDGRPADAELAGGHGTLGPEIGEQARGAEDGSDRGEAREERIMAGSGAESEPEPEREQRRTPPRGGGPAPGERAAHGAPCSAGRIAGKKSTSRIEG